MTNLEKVATYLRTISKTTSLAEAQQEALLALQVIEKAKGEKK